jgi:hypothetical protein
MARDFSIEIITSLLFGVKINHIIGFTHSIRAAMIHVISKKESQAMKGDFNFGFVSSTALYGRIILEHMVWKQLLLPLQFVQKKLSLQHHISRIICSQLHS